MPRLVTLRACGKPTAPRAALLAILMLVVAATTGCASNDWVSLRKTPKNPLAEPLSLFARGGPRPSERTELLLRKYALEEGVSDPGQLASRLRQLFDREPSADKLYSVAELAYLGGKKAELTSTSRALELHGAAVMHSYLYLFDERFRPLRNPYDPEFRGACNLYNSALESALRIIKKQGSLHPGTTQTIRAANNHTMELAIIVRGNGWTVDDFDHFEFVSDYEVKGLRNLYHTYGLGVPLIAVRKGHPDQSPGEKFYPPGLSFPVTAFLRLLPESDKSSKHHIGLLELYDPLSAADVVIDHRRVPLESDLSTPLAYCLNQKDLRNLDSSTIGLLHPDKTLKAKGLYMLEPYQPGKIPVLMVHGLWSSPITWMEMFNDLRGAPEIRDHFQFWFYLYPSGEPFWLSATQLRQDLAQMRLALDPHHQEPALDQMVLVGHSMGGLVARLQTIESGNDYWNIISNEPIELVKATPEIKSRLTDNFFFHPSVSVRRVITIATPHRGSTFANDTTRWLGSKLITLPKMLVSGQQQLVRDNPGLLHSRNLIEVPTSIDSLAPTCPILPVMLGSRRPPWVKYHNIVGRIPPHGVIYKVAGDGDGVVPVSSAHLDVVPGGQRLDQVESEIEVVSDHTNVHRNPRSVLEVRRILLEHLTELGVPSGSPLERLPWTAEAENIGQFGMHNAEYTAPAEPTLEARAAP